MLQLLSDFYLRLPQFINSTIAERKCTVIGQLGTTQR